MDPGCIDSLHAVTVLDQPYPIGFGGGKDRKSLPIASLGPGRILFRDRLYKKDVLAYEVKLEDGRTGYVIFDGREMRKCGD